MSYILKYPFYCCLFIVVLFMICFMYFDVKPLWSTYGEDSLQLQVLQNKLQSLTKLEVHQQKSVLTQKEKNTALMQLVLCAKQAGLQIELVNTKHETDAILSAQMVTIGSLPSILFFFESLSKLKFIVLMNNILLTVDSRSHVKLNAQAIICSTLMDKKPFIQMNVDSVNKLLTNTTRDNNSNLSDVATPVLSSLKIPFKQIKIIGSIVDNNNVLMIVRLPNGVIDQVHEGDVIGLEKIPVRLSMIK